MCVHSRTWHVLLYFNYERHCEAKRNRTRALHRATVCPCCVAKSTSASNDVIGTWTPCGTYRICGTSILERSVLLGLWFEEACLGTRSCSRFSVWVGLAFDVLSGLVLGGCAHCISDEPQILRRDSRGPPQLLRHSPLR